MHYLRVAVALTVAAGLLFATPLVAADTPEVPQPPEFELPVPADDVLVVANDKGRFTELKQMGYRVYPDITTAISRAMPGVAIHVTAGTYHEDLFLYQVASLELIGEEGVLVIADNDQDVCFMRECVDIRIHNIDMVHEIGESPCLHNCIVVWDCSDVLVEYCDLSGCGYFGVEVLGNGEPRGIRVENCAIHDCEEAFYDVPGAAILLSGNVLWNNGTEEWNPTGGEEGEMFGSEPQPSVDYADWLLPDDVPQPPAIELPSPATRNLLVVIGDEMTEDALSIVGYDTYFNIQDALDAAQAGDTVYVTAGVYFETLGLNGRENVEVVGEEQVLVVGSFSADVFTISDCRNIRISNIDVVHEFGEDCSENCYVINESQDVLIEYCDISGCGHVGVWAYGFDQPCDVRVEYCYIHDCAYAHASHGEARLDMFGTVVRNNEAVEMF